MHGISALRLLVVGVVLILNVKESKQQNSNQILRAATIVFRHGDRNPIQSYPGDIFRNETMYWPEGYGAMTAAGKVRLYNLGWYMRKRYPTFHRKNVVVYTSDTNRTITSAMSNLAGFYGQNRSFLKHVDSFNPRGLGIKVIPQREDDFILIRKPCPKYDRLSQKYFNETRPMDKYKDAVNMIYSKTGLNFSTFSIDAVLFADTILIQKSKNLKLPQWIEDLHKDDIFYEIRDEYFVHLMPTFELKRLRTGAMIKRFLDDTDNVVKSVATQKLQPNFLQHSQTDFPKITIISGHDSTLVDWMIDLDIFDWQGPPYGAAIFMELYEEAAKLHNDNTVFSIKVFYKNDSENESVQMHLPGCPSPCYYTNFKKMLLPLVVNNLSEECKISNDNNKNDVSVHFSDTNEKNDVTVQLYDTNDAEDDDDSNKSIETGISPSKSNTGTIWNSQTISLILMYSSLSVMLCKRFNI